MKQRHAKGRENFRARPTRLPSERRAPALRVTARRYRAELELRAPDASGSWAYTITSITGLPSEINTGRLPTARTSVCGSMPSR